MQTLVSQTQAGKAQPGYEHWGPAAEKISTKHLFSCQLGTFPSLGCPVSLPQLALASLFTVLCLLHLYTEFKYSPLLLGQCRFFSLSGSDFDVCGSHRDTDVHTVASLLKLYLRELPEPVVPWIQYEDFLLCGQALDMDERKGHQELLEQLSLLPRDNYNLLSYICRSVLCIRYKELRFGVGEGKYHPKLRLRPQVRPLSSKLCFGSPPDFC